MPRAYNPLPLIGYFLCAFCFGLVFDFLGFKFYAIVTMLCILTMVLVAPTKWAIMATLGFISVQGFLKVVSNYHPVIHVGADLIVILLIAKFLYLYATSQINEGWQLPPISKTFMVHFAWIGIVYFNPYSLGLIPSIAGSKVYITMFLLYFFGFYLTKNLKDVHHFFYLFIGFALLHAVFGIYQGLVGPTSVTQIHPRYLLQLAKLEGKPFRPFGLTNLPGGPSVYIYTCLPFVLYLFYQTRSHLLRLFLISSLPIFGLTLMMCQVRSAIVKGLVAMFVFGIGLVTSQRSIPFVKRLQYVGAGFSMMALIGLAIPQLMNFSQEASTDNTAAFERSLSSFDIEAMSKARKDTLWRFKEYTKIVPFGAGFSRVGAAAGAFKKYHKNEDNVFPPDLFFADNLFIAAVIETGLPGLFIICALVALVMSRCLYAWREENRTSLIAPQLAIASSLFAIAIGSYGSESILYNPESAFFWLFAGILVKMQQPDFESTPL